MAGNEWWGSTTQQVCACGSCRMLVEDDCGDQGREALHVKRVSDVALRSHAAPLLCMGSALAQACYAMHFWGGLVQTGLPPSQVLNILLEDTGWYWCPV